MRGPSAAGAAHFAQIDAIRAASASIEAQVEQLPPDDLATFTVPDNSRWLETA